MDNFPIKYNTFTQKDKVQVIGLKNQKYFPIDKYVTILKHWFGGYPTACVYHFIKIMIRYKQNDIIQHPPPPSQMMNVHSNELL